MKLYDSNLRNKEKWLKIMRVTVIQIFLAILFAGVSYAKDSYAQINMDQRLDLNMHDAKLEKILEKIEKITDAKFVYSINVINLNQKISVDAKSETLDEILNEVLVKSGIGYYVYNNLIVLGPFPGNNVGLASLYTPTIISVYTADIEVHGKITNSTGEPLIGVTVKAKSGGNGAVTDANGEYTIVVPSDAVLDVSYVGYQSQEVSVNGRRNINIVLSASVSELNQLVVVGYGTQRKRDVTGTVSTISGDAIENVPVSNAASALEGKASGVGIVFTNGQPGGVPSIRIRGTGTINNADPLVVIDGVPAGGLNDVNPNDIASIEVLKDASSSAIYGARAANGVVLITTKSGSYNQPMKVTLNYYTGTNKVIKDLGVLKAPDLAMLKQEAYTNDGLSVPPIWTDPNTAVQRTDWQKSLFKTGSVNNVDVALRGGGENSIYSFSGNYYNESGIIPLSGFKRYSFRINSDHRIGKRLKVGERITYSNTIARGPNTSTSAPNTSSAQTGVIWSALRFNPSIPVKDADGNWGTAQGNNELGDINNPLTTIYENSGYAKTDRILANAFAEFEIAEGLKIRANYGYDQSTSEGYNFAVATPTQTRGPSTSSLGQNFSKTKTFLEEYFVTYDKNFNDVHRVNVVAGYSSQVFTGNHFGAFRSGFTDVTPANRVLDLGQNSSNNGTDDDAFGLQSAFLRANYSYKEKYLLTATFRADGSSKFAPGKRWGYFPAFSLGWRISDEKFFQNVKVINSLKLTGGWGQLGNQNIGDFQYLNIITLGAGGQSYNFGENNTSVNGAYITSLPNPVITWEKAEMTNLGLDFAAFNNHVSGTITYYNKTTSDMLVLAQLVQTYGDANLPNVNQGEINNRGVEIDLDYNNTIGKWSFSVGGNASFAHNEVTRLYGNTSYLGAPLYGRTNTDISRTYEGQPIASFFGFKTDGIYQNQNDIDSDPNIANDPNKGDIKPGDVRFVDINGDGVVDDEDRGYLGDPNPSFVYGFHGSVNYANFDFAFSFSGVAGVDLYNADRLAGLYSPGVFNWYAEQINRWHGEGTSNSIPRVSKQDLNDNYRSSDLWVQNGSFLSLKSISLGYTVADKTIGNWKIPDLRVYVSSHNVFYLTKYKGYTPEIGYHDNSNLMRGVDFAQYPQSRNFTVGATINF